MTTSCVQKNLFLALCLIALVSPLVASAQLEDTFTTDSEGVVVEGVEEVVSAGKAPWFRIEQLSGDPLPVGDFVVGPGRAEIQVQPGQTLVYEISVTNRISDNRTFELSVEDIAGSEDANRSVELLGQAAGPHSVKDYISFPENSFTLNLGERARIPVTISLPPNTPPGGYYGSVLVSTVQEEVPEVGQLTRSPIIARVGTLFFITTPGEVNKSGETKSLSLKGDRWWYERGPMDFSILFENTGSVHLNPYGEMRVTNLFGEEVGFVELEPWFALPDSFRSRDITWDRELLFGRYVATAKINRGYDDLVDERSVVFWVLPWKVVGGIFIIVFIIVFSIRLFFRTFEFKRKS
jgi:hypothetical protein